MSKFLYKMTISLKNIDMFQHLTKIQVRQCYVHDTPEKVYKHMKYLVDYFCEKYTEDMKFIKDDIDTSYIYDHDMNYCSVNLRVIKDNNSVFYEGSAVKQPAFEEINMSKIDEFYKHE